MNTQLFLEKEQYFYQPKTDFGKKLWQIRAKILHDLNIQLLDLQEIELELDELRNRA